MVSTVVNFTFKTKTKPIKHTYTHTHNCKDGETNLKNDRKFVRTQSHLIGKHIIFTNNKITAKVHTLWMNISTTKTEYRKYENFTSVSINDCFIKWNGYYLVDP